jgi:hypothetical protein
MHEENALHNAYKKFTLCKLGEIFTKYFVSLIYFVLKCKLHRKNSSNLEIMYKFNFGRNSAEIEFSEGRNRNRNSVSVSAEIRFIPKFGASLMTMYSKHEDD